MRTRVTGLAPQVNNSFHDSSGMPLVNTTTFPSMGDMVKKGHSLGLGVGFYVSDAHPRQPSLSNMSLFVQINNCICNENIWRGDPFHQVVYDGTAKAIVDWDFDG
jgi:hypothetical protein